MPSTNNPDDSSAEDLTTAEPYQPYRLVLYLRDNNEVELHFDTEDGGLAALTQLEEAAEVQPPLANHEWGIQGFQVRIAADDCTVSFLAYGLIAYAILSKIDTSDA